MGVQTRDPWRTASILLAFFIEYNIVLALVQTALSVLSGDKINPMDRVFDYRECHFNSIPGYKAALVHLVTACLTIPIQVAQIQRAKLVLDFSLTIQFTQFLITWAHSGALPRTLSWWFIWLFSSCIMVFGGEYACMQIELQPIIFGATAADITNASVTGDHGARDAFASRPTRGAADDIEMQERESLVEEGRALNMTKT